MPDPLDKYRKRYEELKTPTKEPKSATKTESVNNTDIPDQEFQTDYPTLKYNEYNLPNLDWLSQDVKDRALQLPTIENPQEGTKVGTQKTSRGDVEQYKQTVAEDERIIQNQVAPLIEHQKIKESLFTPVQDEFVLPDKLQLNDAYKEFKAEDDQFIQGMQEMPVSEDTKNLINNEWKQYTIERDREQLGAKRYLDATLKGLGRSIYTGFGWLPEEYLPKSVKKMLQENYDGLSDLEKHVSDVAQTVADIYVGLGLSSKLVSPFIKMMPIKSLVGQKIMHSTATLVVPTLFKEEIKAVEGDFNAEETFQNLMTTGALGVAFGSNPFKNVALKTLYDVIVPTGVQEVLTQPALNPLDDSGQPFDWNQAGKDAFFNVMFGVMQGYREGKGNYLLHKDWEKVNQMDGEQMKNWVKENVEAIENDMPVSPAFKELLQKVQDEPVVQETIKDVESKIVEMTTPKPKLKYLGDNIYKNVANEQTAPVTDVERNVKSTVDADIQVGEEVFTYGGFKGKVLEVTDRLATIQTESGKTIKIGVSALKREPLDPSIIESEKEIRRMIDGTDNLEMWDDVRVQGAVEDSEITHGSEIQFVAGVKKVLNSIVGKTMNFAEMVANKPVARDFARDKGLKFTGRQLEGTPDTWSDQIVDMYKVFRSGKVENNVLVGINEGGKIVGTMALTANHPMYVGYKLSHLGALVQAGAKHIVVGHNHPSGNPIPSMKDLQTHALVAQHMRLYYPDTKLEGSYVINHKKYSWISDVVSDQMNAQYEVRDMKNALPDLTNRVGMNMRDETFKEALVQHAKEISKDDNVILVQFDNLGEIRDFSVIPLVTDKYGINTGLADIIDHIELRAGDTGGGLYKILTKNTDILTQVIQAKENGSLPIGGEQLIQLKEDGSTGQTWDLGKRGASRDSSVIFEDMPFNVDSFKLESGLDLADDNIFERTLNKISDDTFLGRMVRGRKKISDTVAWNNVMIDVERYTTKYPVMRKLYQVIDKVLVRNMQYDYNFGRKEVWKDGKSFKEKGTFNRNGMEKEEQTELLVGLDEWHKMNRDLQESGYPLLTEQEFIEKFVRTEQQLKAVNDMIAVKEHGLKMMKTTDVYILEYKQTTNPFLEEYYQKRTVTDDAGRKAMLEKAIKEMNELLAENGMEDFVEHVMANTGAKRPIDVLNALWREPEVKAMMMQRLVEMKYAEHEKQFYFPTTRMEGDYFIRAIDRNGKPFFATYKKLSEVRAALKDLSERRYTIKNFDATKDLTAQVDNFKLEKLLFKEQYIPSDISVPEIQQLAVKSGLNMSNPVVQKMMETLNARGFKRHFIQKQYVEGFKWTETDVANAMESYLWGVSVHKNRTIGRMLAEFEQVKAKENGATDEQMSFMQDYLEQFDDHTKDYGQSIRRATSLWWLAGKVSYYMQQVLQPINTTLPYIMKEEFGGAKNLQHFTAGFTKDLMLYEWYRTYKMLGAISPEVMQKVLNVFGEEGLQIMDDLKLEGVLSSNNINDILGVQTRIEHQNKGILGRRVDNLMSVISTPSSLVEATPRTGSALTLLRIGKQMGLTGDNLKNFVSTGIARVMGKAAPKMGVPNVVNRFGDTMRVILRYPFVFRQFSAMNTGLYGHLMDGKSGIWKILNPAMLTKLGVGFTTRGIRYAPFVGSMVGIASLSANLYQWIKNSVLGSGGEDDDIDVDQIVYNMEEYLNNEFGDAVGTSIVRGTLTALTGVDVSKIFQESTVLPTETLEYERDATATLGGAPVAFVSQMIQAVQHEDWKKVLPVAVTNVIRALPSEVIQRIIESEWIPMTLKKSLVNGNIDTSGISFKGNPLALPNELTSTVGGMDAIGFARLMKLLGFTTLEITRIYENAKYIQDRNASYLDNIDTIEEENKSFEQKDQLKVNEIIRKTNQKIGSELNKNKNVYTLHTFGEYLDDIVEDLRRSKDPIVLAYADKISKPEYRKAIFKRAKIKGYSKLYEEKRISKEEYIDTRTKINKIIEEIK